MGENYELFFGEPSGNIYQNQIAKGPVTISEEGFTVGDFHFQFADIYTFEIPDVRKGYRIRVWLKNENLYFIRGNTIGWPKNHELLDKFFPKIVNACLKFLNRPVNVG